MNFSSPLFSYCFKATARVSLLLATASVFRKWSGSGMTLHLTLLDMRLEHVHCSVTFCSLKITQMLGPVWHCGLCVAGQRPAIFISTTPCNPSPSHTLSVCCPENCSCVSHFISFESDMFLSSLTASSAGRACLQLASVNHGSATWVSPVRHWSAAGLGGICTVWSL